MFSKMRIEKPVIIFVVAAELEKTPSGRVFIGEETQIACDAAVDLYRYYQGQLQPTIIITAAGKAGKEYDFCIMSEVMGRYITKRISTDAEVVALRGEKFNTDGEVGILTEYLRINADKFSRVIVCVKWWHARRTRALIWLRFKQAGVNVPIEIHKCHSNAGILAVLKEYCFAIEINIDRIAGEFLAKLFGMKSKWPI